MHMPTIGIPWNVVTVWIALPLTRSKFLLRSAPMPHQRWSLPLSLAAWWFLPISPAASPSITACMLACGKGQRDAFTYSAFFCRPRHSRLPGRASKSARVMAGGSKYANQREPGCSRRAHSSEVPSLAGASPAMREACAPPSLCPSGAISPSDAGFSPLPGRPACLRAGRLVDARHPDCDLAVHMRDELHQCSRSEPRTPIITAACERYRHPRSKHDAS